MPVTVPRRCSTCRQLSVGPCSTCTRLADQRRGSRTARGYDEHWQRVRAAHLASEPHCRFCAARGITVDAEQVDHIVRFGEVGDPLRLDPRNLRSLCASCHAKHTRATDARPGMSRHESSAYPNRAGERLFEGHDRPGPVLR